MHLTFLLVLGSRSGLASSDAPVLSIDPGRGLLAEDLRSVIAGCFKEPTSIELDLRNYPDDLGLRTPLVWRQKGSPVTTSESNSARHLRNVEVALESFNQAVAAANPLETGVPWSPLVYEDGVIHHEAQTGFLHTCREANDTGDTVVLEVSRLIRRCQQAAEEDGERISVNMRGLWTEAVSIPAGSTLTLFEALKRNSHPWHFSCFYFEPTETKPERRECFLGRLPTYFVNEEGRLRILESYARTGPTGCDGIP